MVVMAGALPKLIHLLGDGCLAVQFYAADIINSIANIMGVPEGRTIYTDLVVSGGAIPPLIRLMRSDSDEAACTAACAILSIPAAALYAFAQLVEYARRSEQHLRAMRDSSFTRNAGSR